MPFQITIAIDPSKKIRKFLENSCTKNKNSEKNSGESTRSRSLDKSSQSESSDKEMISESITVFRNTNSDQSDYQTDQKSDKEVKYSSIFMAEDSDKIEKRKSSSDTELDAKKLSIAEPKPCFPGIFKKLFITSKKKEHPPQIEPAQTKQNRACDDAINAFNTLLEDENSLEALVGKAFSLNTMVTIQSIEDDGKPNLILSGSIPFQLTTKHGIINKKVHVKGKLYSPKKEEGNQTRRYEIRNANTQSVIRIKVNEKFKFDSSKIQKVSWLTSKIFTQDEYNHRFHCIRYIDVPNVHTVENMWLQKKVNNLDGQERLRYITNIDKSTSSVNIIEAGHLKSNSCVSAVEHKEVQLPVTSITIARSKTRLIKFTDGTDFTEKVGRNVITLAAPEGILYFPGERSGEMDDSFGTMIRRENMAAINCEDNMFTRSCFQMAKDDGEYALSRSINYPKRFGHERSKRSHPEVKDLDPQTYYPPGNYSHILTDRYNPLTWIYQNFDKTKRFVQEFNCE